MQLDRYYGRIAEAGVEILAVSVDPPDVSRRLRDRLDSEITFLSDPDGELLDRLGIRHRDPPGRSTDIAYPTAILVDGEGIIRWIYQSDTYRRRAAPDEIFAAISALRP